MIGWLVGLGLSRRAAIGVLGLVGVLIIMAAFYMSLTFYGKARYDAGKKDADAAWIAASNKLIQQAQASGQKADTASAARAADFAAKQEDEKRKIENAQQNGASPFDVMFGNGA